jgi:hypothetical protein
MRYITSQLPVWPVVAASPQGNKIRMSVPEKSSPHDAQKFTILMQNTY